VAALDFESLFSTRSLEEYRQAKRWRANRFEYLSTEEKDWNRALDVQGSLALRGRLREVGMADLLIAAVCERNRVALLHYDSHFETIAEVTGQDARWVVPRGSVP
jgi:predicted nucleic acid-binding protein